MVLKGRWIGLERPSREGSALGRGLLCERGVWKGVVWRLWVGGDQWRFGIVVASGCLLGLFGLEYVGKMLWMKVWIFGWLAVLGGLVVGERGRRPSLVLDGADCGREMAGGRMGVALY